MFQQHVLALHLMRLRQSQLAFEAARQDLTQRMLLADTRECTRELLAELEHHVAQTALCIEKLTKLGVS